MKKISLLSLAAVLLIQPSSMGCGRGDRVDTPVHNRPRTSSIASPAPSFVLEKITDYDGWLLYERQELTADSVFYLAVDVRSQDTLEQWREARISAEELETQSYDTFGRVRMVWHDLYLLFEVNRRVHDEAEPEEG